MPRTSKLFLAAVLIGCGSGLASAGNTKQLGPPSPVGKVIPDVPPLVLTLSKTSVPYGPPSLLTPLVTKTPAFDFDPFTLSTSGNKSDKGDKNDKSAPVFVAVVCDDSHRPDRSPGDKDHDHDHDGKGDHDAKGDHDGKGDHDTKGDKDDKGDHDDKGDGGRGQNK